MTFGELFGAKKFLHLTLSVTNLCNLHCEYCLNLCESPIQKDSPHIWRRNVWELSPAMLSIFCERMKGIGENDLHLLTGGEPTAIPVRRLQALTDVLISWKRKIALLTNGYGLMDLPKEYVRQISHIWLDNHGTNLEVVAECRHWLSDFGYRGVVHVKTSNKYHFNYRAGMAHPLNQGRRCRRWLTTPELSPRGILHPCCNTQWLMAHNNDTRMEDELKAAGWHVHNPDLVETLRNWRSTMPAYVNDQCLNVCWWPNNTVGGRVKITAKPNDVLQRKPGGRAE